MKKQLARFEVVGVGAADPSKGSQKRPMDEQVINQDFPGKGHGEEPGDEPPLD